MITLELVARGLARRTLVLTPPSLVEQWQSELSRKFGLASIAFDAPLFREQDPAAWGRHERIVASYHTAKREPHRSAILAHEWDLVIIDEAHHLRNRATVLWQFAAELRKKYILLLTFDLPWNPMRIEQRIGRLSRIGQTRDVYVFNLVAAETLEAAILHLLDAKIAMFELVVGEVDMILGNLDDEQEFEDLVASLWADAADEAAFHTAIDQLGERLVAARTAYLRQRAHDDRLFGERFAPEALPEHPHAQLLTFGLPLLDELLSTAQARALSAHVYYESRYLQPYRLDQQVRRDLTLPTGTTLALIGPRPAYVAHAIFWFEVSYLGDEKTQALIAVAVDRHYGRLVRHLDPLLADPNLSEERRWPFPNATSLPLAQSYLLARDRLIRTVAAEANSQQRARQNQAGREIERMERYFADMAEELETRISRATPPSRSAGIPSPKRLMPSFAPAVASPPMCSALTAEASSILLPVNARRDAPVGRLRTQNRPTGASHPRPTGLRTTLAGMTP